MPSFAAIVVPLGTADSDGSRLFRTTIYVPIEASVMDTSSWYYDIEVGDVVCAHNTLLRDILNLGAPKLVARGLSFV